MIRKAQVVPGFRATVVKNMNSHGIPFGLDEHLSAFSQPVQFKLGETLEALTKPRRSKDGINLVRVRRSDGTEGEIFYLHFHENCD